jgi:hypothetical protein
VGVTFMDNRPLITISKDLTPYLCYESKPVPVIYTQHLAKREETIYGYMSKAVFFKL